MSASNRYNEILSATFIGLLIMSSDAWMRSTVDLRTHVLVAWLWTQRNVQGTDTGDDYSPGNVTGNL